MANINHNYNTFSKLTPTFRTSIRSTIHLNDTSTTTMADDRLSCILLRLATLFQLLFVICSALICVEAACHKLVPFSVLGISVSKNIEIAALIYTLLYVASVLVLSNQQYTVYHDNGGRTCIKQRYPLDQSKKPNLDTRLLYIAGIISVLALTFFILLEGLLAMMEVPVYYFESIWARCIAGYGLWFLYGATLICCLMALYRLLSLAEAAGQGFENDLEEALPLVTEEKLEV